MTSSPPGATLDIDGARLHYHDIGQGRPVVLLHGAGPGATGWTNFRRSVPALSARFRLILVDQPGFGQSELPARRDVSPYRAFAEAVVAVLDELGIERASVVGNSLGGGTALRLAVDFPDRVDRLVLMAPGGGSLALLSPGEIEQRVGRLLVGFLREPTSERMRDFIAQMVHDKKLVDQFVEERLATAAQPEVLDALRQFLEWTRTTPKRELELWRDVDQIPHETLLIWGRDDSVLPVDASLFLLRRMNSARLLVFPKCGHWAQIERQAEFEDAVLTFLTPFPDDREL